MTTLSSIESSLTGGNFLAEIGATVVEDFGLEWLVYGAEEEHLTKPIVGDFFTNTLHMWRFMQCDTWCIVFLTGIGVIYLLHILQMSIEMKGWADANIWLLLNSLLVSAQATNAVFIILSPFDYWQNYPKLRYAAWIFSAITIGIYGVVLIDLAITVIAGKSLYGDVSSMMVGFITFYLTPGFLISLITFVLQLASGEYNPKVHNVFTDEVRKQGPLYIGPHAPHSPHYYTNGLNPGPERHSDEDDEDEQAGSELLSADSHDF